jgi:hypothetical protein
MSDVSGTKTIFIKEGALLPATLSIESEAFLPGWRVVRNLDRYEAAKLDEQEGPQREAERLKKETDGLAIAREKNQKSFHP